MKTYFDKNNTAIDYTKTAYINQEGLDVNIVFDFTYSKASTICSAEHVIVQQPVTKEKVIDAIISSRYSNADMQALINNHIFEPNDEHEDEFVKMQQWRKKAKDVAAFVMENI